MAAKYKIGESVKQIVVPITGTIGERTIVGDDDMYRVDWTDEAGEKQSRIFKEDEIQLVA